VLHISQAFIVGCIFGWYNEDGTRRFRTAFVEIGKGNGKSPLAAGIGLYMLTADGQQNAEVYASAAVKDQAKIQYRDAVNMVLASEDLQERLQLHGEKEVYNMVNLRTKGFFKPISAEKRGLDGKRVHCSLIDELHEHPSAIVANKMRAGTKGMRNALVFEITNSGVDRTSICYQHHEYSKRVVEGTTPDDAWFAYVCGMDEGDDPLKDESCWVKANPLLGVTITRALPARAGERGARHAGAGLDHPAAELLHVGRRGQPGDRPRVWMACQHLRVLGARRHRAAGRARPCPACEISRRWRSSGPATPAHGAVEFWTPKEGCRSGRSATPCRGTCGSRRGTSPRRPAARSTIAGWPSAWARCSSSPGCAAWRATPTGSSTSSASSRRRTSRSSWWPTARASSRRPTPGSGCRTRSRSSRSCSAAGRSGILIKPNPALTFAAASAVHESDPKENRVYTKRKSRGRIDGIVALTMAAGFADDPGDSTTIPADYVPSFA
jgi:hypothetical protein